MPFKNEKIKKQYMKEYHKKWVIKNSERISTTKYEYRNTEKGFLKKTVSTIFAPSRIKRRGLIPLCTKEEIENYFYEYVKKYGKNCYYCFEPWTYITKKYKYGYGRTFEKHIKNEKNFSIDRFDNNKSYSIDNIVFCCVQCNQSKRDLPIKIIKRLNEIITERNL